MTQGTPSNLNNSSFINNSYGLTQNIKEKVYRYNRHAFEYLFNNIYIKDIMKFMKIFLRFTIFKNKFK